MLRLLSTLVLFLPSLSTSSSAPWQTAVTINNVVEEKNYKDLPPIVFSGSGRLYNVEAIMADTVSMEDASSNLCVAIRCSGGVVVVSTMTKSPHLDLEDDGDLVLEDPLISRPFCNIAPALYCATGGNAIDSQLLRDKIHQIAATLYESLDAGQLIAPSRVSSSVMARHLADQLQRPTQTLTAGPMLASFAILFQYDSLWRVDPTGQFWCCRAACIGKGAPLAEKYLEEHWNDNLTIKEAIQICCNCIKHVLPKEKAHWRGLILRQTEGIEILSSKRLRQDDS